MIWRLLSKPRHAAQTRDTNQDWAIIGETEPYYGVLTDERFKREHLDDEVRAEFFNSGQLVIQSFIDRMRTEFGPFSPKSALDFGCGVGRLTVPLAALTGAATGIDISPGMLVEARKHPNPGLRFLDRIPDDQFDWVVSDIVLQHIPPERGYDIIKALLDRVSPNGGATIQIIIGRSEFHENSAGARLVIGHEGVWPAVSKVDLNKIPDGVMIMHDYDLSRVVGLFYRAGLKNLFLASCDHDGMVATTIYARRQD